MQRTGFIGGSDATQIMQGNWLELWQVKTGRAEPQDLSDNIAVQLGIHTESFNLKWFEERTHQEVTNRQLEVGATIQGVPTKGTIDGMANNAIVEAKHTNAMNNMESVIAYYMPQLQTYIRLANTEGAFLSVIFGNNKWESAYVGRNDQYFDSMWAVVSDFWGYVVRDEEPIGCDTPSVSIDKVEVDNMVRRDASRDNAFIDACHDYIENQDQARAFELAKKTIKEMVGSNEREVYCDLLTVKRAKNGSLRITTRKKD